MKRITLFRVALMTLTFMVAGCGQVVQQEEGIPAELTASIDAFYAAIEAGDTEAHIAQFADSAIMMPNHWTMTQGSEAIAEGMRAATGYVFRLRDREIVDIDVSGDIAYTVNSYYYTWHPEGEQPQWHKTKNVHIWKKTADGQWRLHVDIWNSDVPISQFSEE